MAKNVGKKAHITPKAIKTTPMPIGENQSFEAGQYVGDVRASVALKFDGMRDVLATKLPESKDKTALLQKLNTFIGEWKIQTNELFAGVGALLKSGSQIEA